jgi:hypothetical protein
MYGAVHLKSDIDLKLGGFQAQPTILWWKVVCQELHESQKQSDEIRNGLRSQKASKCSLRKKFKNKTSDILWKKLKKRSFELVK